jgi:TolB-like protein/DNA-binding winged helix-turn-helix (wHTH) protein
MAVNGKVSEPLRFGPFEVSPDSGELRKNGTRLKLSGQAIQVLTILMQNPGRIVAREELQQKLWPGTSFGDFDHGLNAAVNRMREVLGDSATEPKFIETVPRRGYRFIGSVESAPQTSATAAAETIAPRPAQFWQTEESPRSARLHSAVLGSWPKWAVLGGVALAALIILVALFSLVRQRSETVGSVAVLPFVNVTNDPNAEYLGDGITENVINSLSGLPKLKVIARTTVFRFKQRDIDPLTVGHELNVDTIVTGKLVRHGDVVVVQTDLLKVSDGSELWGEQYSRPLADLQAVQEHISWDIASKLRYHLTGEQQKRLRQGHTNNAEAYQLYLKGTYSRNKREVNKAIEYFEQAVQKDPWYALAWVRLSESYSMLALSREIDQRVTFPKAKEAASKALEINDSLGDAHTALATVLYKFDWDWAAAEREYKRALELNASNIFLGYSQRYSQYLASVGRLQEALDEARREQELDPLSPSTAANLAFAYYVSRQFDQALEQSLKIPELTVRNAAGTVPTNFFLAASYAAKGMHEQAIAEFQKFAANPGMLAHLANTYAIAHKRAEAQNVLRPLIERANRENVWAYEVALGYAGLNDNDSALSWLEKAYQQRDPGITFLKVDPCLDPLRSDVRFQELIRRVGLSP